MSDAPRDILDALAQDARVLRRARMLPTDRPLNHEEIRQIAKDVHEWMDESGRSLSSLTRALGEGFSTTTLSAFFKATYKGDCERVARALNAYMEQQVQKAQVARPEGFIEFTICKKMLAVVKAACDYDKIGVVVAPAGSGKSMCAQAVKKMRDTTCILYSAMETERSVHGFVQQLAGLVGLGRHHSVSTLLRTLVEKLRGSGRLLIIDEAQKLDRRAITVVRDIHDNAGIPVVLFGSDEIYALIEDTQSNLGQFSSRVVSRYNATEDMNAIRGGDGSGVRRGRTFLWSATEIVQKFEGNKVRLTDDAIDLLFLLTNALGYGCMRLADGLVKIATKVALLSPPPKNGAERLIDRTLLLKILRQFHGEVYVEVISERSEQLGRERFALTA